MDSKKESEDVKVETSNRKYGYTVQQLQELQNSHTLADPNKPIEMLKEFGGVAAIADKLGVNIEEGLPKDADFADRIAAFGANVIEEPPASPFYTYLWEAWKEPIVVMLSIFAIVSIITNMAFPEDPDNPHRETAWIEGGAVIVAVLLVCFVSAGNNWSMERQFRILNKKKNDRQVKILRGGKEEMIGIELVVVGDIVILETGDYVPADGIYIEGHGLAADESAMTGESKEIKKGPKSPFLISGTKVAEGRGKYLVICVGMASEWGIMYSKLQTEKEQTPMQVNLAVLAKLVGYIGTAAAALVFIVLVIRYIVESVRDDDWVARDLTKLLRIVIVCMALIVVAVPEGLPLAVTICLAYSTKAMLKDNNLVRQLAACETMGGATNICSDKTGTLTENRMTVTNVWACNQLLSPKSADEIVEKDMKQTIDKEVLQVLCESCAVNSSAFLKMPEKANEKVEFFGSKTECALLLMCQRLDFSYEAIRKSNKVISIIPFSSDRKRMNTISTNDKTARLYTKGASEIVLGLCTTYLDKDGSKQKLTEEKKEELMNTINKLASEGLRTLSIAYKDLESTDADTSDKNQVAELEKDCVMIAIVGIKDPLRPEVPAAITQCKNAGIVVRMVTGDNKLTATRIAQDCGILTEDGIVMEGPDFRNLSDAQIDAILPKLRVLARSTPSDKFKLVERLKENNEVVAVTGDGTNDAPALKKANVGMAMGIAGTEIAKEAAAIIIMDDNFASIVKAVLWGRSVRQNIQKFIQFQLTINFVALTAAFIAAVSGAGQPLRPIQLLWINLIQDSLAALALATEKPTDDLLKDKPAGKSERLITPTMWRNMLTTALYQLAVVFFLLYAGDSVFDVTEDLKDDKVRDKDDDPTRHYTMIYNTFVFMQIFNEINCRKLDRSWNCFEGFFDNWLCSAIVVGTVVLQVILVQWAGIVMFTYPLQWQQWLVSIGFGLSMLLFGVINRVLIPIPNFDWLKYTKEGLKQVKAQKGIPDKKAEIDLPTIESKQETKTEA